MKLRHVLPVGFGALLFCLLVCCLNDKTLAYTQNSSVQSAPRNQDQAPDQQALPLDKKRTLASLGPDEIFPGDEEPIAPKSQNTRFSSRRRSAAKLSTDTITAPAVASAVALPEPSLTAQQMVNQLSVTAPARVNYESQTSPQSTSGWQIPTLGFLTVVVFIGLLYVLTKLRELLA